MKIFITTLVLTATCFASSFIKKDAKVFYEDSVVGVIYKGTPVEKKQNSLLLKGWVMDGNEYILFYNQKNRIRLARIAEKYTNRYKVINTKKDDYDVLWKQVELTVSNKNKDLYIGKGLIVGENYDVWAEEATLYERCGSCHKSHTAEEYTVNQWPNVLKTMSERAGLTTKETKSVGKYLQYRALNHKK